MSENGNPTPDSIDLSNEDISGEPAVWISNGKFEIVHWGRTQTPATNLPVIELHQTDHTTMPSKMHIGRLTLKDDEFVYEGNLTPTEFVKLWRDMHPLVGNAPSTDGSVDFLSNPQSVRVDFDEGYVTPGHDFSPPELVLGPDALIPVTDFFRGQDPSPDSNVMGEPYAAITVDLTGCEWLSRDVEGIEKVAAQGSNGPTEVVYLYAGTPPRVLVSGCQHKFQDPTGTGTGMNCYCMKCGEPEPKATASDIEARIADAIIGERERCAQLVNAMGIREQYNYGLTRSAHNFYRAKEAIRRGDSAEDHLSDDIREWNNRPTPATKGSSNG